MPFSRLSSVAVCGIVVALAGCGPTKVAHPDVAPASGIVTYNGAAVADADVILVSAESKKSSWTIGGKTGADGKFTLTTVFAPGTDGNGVPAGDYIAMVVKIDKIETPKPGDMKSYNEMMTKKQAEMQAAKSAPETTGPKALLPVKYSTELSSDLKVKIEKTGNSNIDLKLVD